ncbi:MAG: PIN domain-containing protein [Bacteroidota bacterium]
MRRLFLDTNVVLDLLANRVPFVEDTSILFSLGDTGKVVLSISSLTFANTHYVLAKVKSASQAKSILRKFKVLVEVLPLDDKIIELALNNDQFTDFEDALQYYVALAADQQIIITRNKKDFKASTIPVMTTHEYLASVSN